MSKFEKKFNNLKEAGKMMKEKFGFEDKGGIGTGEEKEKDNPEGETERDLGVFGVWKAPEEKPKIEIKPQEQNEKMSKTELVESKPFTNKDAEDLVKAALGKDAFKREEKPYVYKEIERLKESIGLAKAKLKKAKTDDEKEKAKERVAYFIDELGKAKETRDRIKNFSGKKKYENKPGIRPQIKVDIAESQPKTYNKGILTAQSTPEDLMESFAEQKEIKRRQEQKIQTEKIDLTTPEGREEEIKRIWQEEVLNKEKATEEKADLSKPEGRQKEIERLWQEEAEKHSAAAEKQEEKIEKEIKQEKSWIRGKVEKAANWYKKQPLKYKILFSLGCVGAASASAALGGAVGAAVASAAFAGSALQRILGGMATFVVTEGVLKKAAEKGGRKRTEWESRRHTLEAAVLAAMVGSGKAAEAVRNIAGWLTPDALTTEVKSTIENLKKDTGLSSEQTAPKTPSGTPTDIEAASKPEALFEKHLEYQGGKSIWQESEKQLTARFKEFEALGGEDVKTAEALKTYNIDRVKDAIVNAIQNNDEKIIEKYNLSGINPDKITAEQLQAINWDNVFKDVFSENELTAGLESGQIESIVGNNAALRQFFSEHPNAPRTIENYEAILKGRGVTGELSAELPTEPESIKVPPEYFDGSKKMLYEEQLDELSKKYPAKEISFPNVQNWLEDKAKIDVEKSSWLNENFLKNTTVEQALDSNFIGDRDPVLGYRIQPESGSPLWQEFHNREKLRDFVKKFFKEAVRQIPGHESDFKNKNLLEFFDFFKNYK
jgi:hypothetical protein